MSKSKCPFCAEEVKSEAIKCKHCHADLSKFRLQESKIASKRRDQKNLLTLLAAFVCVLILIVDPPVFAIILTVGGVGWFLHKRPSTRAKLALSAKRVGMRIWQLLLLFVKKHRLPIAGAALLLLVASGVYRMFTASSPVISLNESYDFSGEVVSIAGQVRADCRCSVEATLNDLPLALEADGSFTYNLTVGTTDDTGSIRVSAQSKPLYFSSNTMTTTAESSYSRKPTFIDVSNIPQEWGNSKVTLTLLGQPDAAISVAEVPGAQTRLDGQGNGTVTVRFNLAYNVENNGFTIRAKADGYADGTKVVAVKNQKYDGDRVAKEVEAEKLRELAENTKKNMESYSGNGDVQLAVSSEIPENRCISYSCANDGWKFITVAAVVRNAGNGVLYANPNDFTLQDSGGQTFTYDSSTFSYDHPFDAVSLQPNANTSGVLVFLVPKEETLFTLIYAGVNGSVAKPIAIL